MVVALAAHISSCLYQASWISLCWDLIQSSEGNFQTDEYLPKTSPCTINFPWWQVVIVLIPTGDETPCNHSLSPPLSAPFPHLGGVERRIKIKLVWEPNMSWAAALEVWPAGWQRSTFLHSKEESISECTAMGPHFRVTWLDGLLSSLIVI